MIKQLFREARLSLAERSIRIQSAVDAYSGNRARLKAELEALGCSESEVGYFLNMAKTVNCPSCGEGS
jgi:hypothetical protein